MILIINTADSDKATVALAKNGKIITKKIFQSKFKQAEKLLAEIDKLISKQKLTANKLKGIIVVSGPGPFTALRIGVVVANTLAWALKIPVVDVKLNEFDNLNKLAQKSQKLLARVKKQNIVEPFYGKAPNITSKK